MMTPQSAQRYQIVLELLRKEFGPQSFSSYESEGNGYITILAVPIEGMDPLLWTCRAALVLHSGASFRIVGSVYAVWRNVHSVRLDPKLNIPQVNALGPPWEALRVGLSALLVRLKRILPEATLTFMEV